MRYALLSVMLMVAGCGGEAGVTGAITSMSPIEAQVAKFVRDNANDPGSVEFVRWGPNAKPGEYKEPKQGERQLALTLTKVGDPPRKPKPIEFIDNQTHVVRLVYREKNLAGALELKDGLYYVATTGFIYRRDNFFGDAWLAMFQEGYKKHLAKND